MDVAIGLLWVGPEEIVESEVNVMREEFEGGRKVFFGGELGVACGIFVLVEGAFGFNRRGLLATGKREVKAWFGVLEGGQGFFQFFYFFL